MKFIKILTSPILVVILFSLILVSGEHFGGFYIMYLLMAIPHGGLHAIFAMVGIGLVLFSYRRYRGQAQFIIEPILNIIGIFLLYASLLFFFYRSWEYNDQTFEQGVPVTSLILFGVVSIAFLIQSVTSFAQ